MKTAAGESFLHGEVKAFKMQNGRIGGADHREDAKGQWHGEQVTLQTRPGQSLSKSVGNWRKLTKKLIAWGGTEDARIGMFGLTPCDF